MVHRILKFLSREISGVHEAAYLLGLFAIVSQVLALVRDRLFASYFGAGHALDMYYTAFRIPDVLFVTVASLVSMSVLIPFLIEKTEQGKEATNRFINSVFSLFFFLIVVASTIAFFLIPRLTDMLFPGLATGESRAELITLSRMLLLSPLLLGISNFLGSITQMMNRFFIYALSPVLYNIGIIIGVLWLSPVFGVQGLVYGVILGAVLHMGIQIPFIVRHGYWPRLTFSISIADVRRVVLISIPRAFTVSAPELARLALVSIASLMAVGSISVFTFAYNLESVPLSIIGVSYSLAAFPILTRHFVGGNKEKFVEHMIACTRHVVFLSMPISILFIVLRAQIVRTILGSGQFTWSDTKLTAACLAIFVISLIPQSLSLLFVRAHYSSGNTRVPLVVNTLSALSVIAGAFAFTHIFSTYSTVQYFFESLFKVEDIQGSVVLMLALAYLFGTWVGFVAFWVLFQREYKAFARPVLATIFQSFAASVIMGFVAYKFLAVFDDVFNINTLLGIFLQGLLSGLIGIAVGIVLLKALKSKEMDEMWSALHRKFWKAKVIGPDPEVG